MNSTHNISVQNMLSGEQAFYKQDDYRSSTDQDMISNKPVNLVYKHTIENKVWRVAKMIFSIIIFPIGLYRLVHSLIGKVAALPASNPALMARFGVMKGHPDRSRGMVDLDSEWKVKRISIEVDGYTIDAAIMGKASTLGNGRWTLYSNGNGEYYEDVLRRPDFKHILSTINGNLITFNYPGVASSSGMPSRSAMKKAYTAMLKFLEDEEKGIGAKEIVGLGHSIGGGVQGDVLNGYQLKEDVKYVFVKSRTFSNISTLMSKGGGFIFGFAAKIFGWNISSIESSKNLQAHEIILQTADTEEPVDVSNSPYKIKGDGVIPAQASLAAKLLELEECKENPKKYFMGVPEGHNDGFPSFSALGNKINEFLAQQA